LRLGIGHPGVRELVTPYLLGRTSAAERAALEVAAKAAADILPLIIEQGAERAMQKLHTRAAQQE
jgi:PTH1 family peptidyl-tRNA hydrolase